MRKTHGSVAAAQSAVPESTVKSRAKIRKALLRAVPVAQDLASAAASRLDAPDPESALVYLRELRDLCSETLDRLDR